MSIVGQSLESLRESLKRLIERLNFRIPFPPVISYISTGQSCVLLARQLVVTFRAQYCVAAVGGLIVAVRHYILSYLVNIILFFDSEAYIHPYSCQWTCQV